ncbi:3-oxoacyl-ACP reductase [Brachybacterium endophyticum]|uniref:3-oxoacyl-ACP reductase n=1 Tax=Brachybacterium endophyticum TaxID=2182385 RepID=A0A2U2RPM2_9MICO|nr:3-oxoacyl-ACP reductase [Brachybacterium endophyticum]PWH07823.1 3-oxoacyl-ACP reductase [Brachybacterium endophyticum]
MTDAYTRFTRTALGRQIVKKAGLPNPARLPRQADRPEPVLDPVVVLGSSAGADEVAALLLDWGADVRRRFEETPRVGSVVVVLDEVSAPRELGEIVLPLAGAMRSLAPGARVVTLSRPATGEDLARDAARGGVEGFVRTLGHEMRRGGTANGIQVADGVALTAPGVATTLRFLLSARSAFVDGQLIEVSTDAGRRPQQWDRPLEGKTALVTGAARGIGAAIARTLDSLGAELVLLDVPASGSELSRVTNELRATPLQLDVTSEAAGARTIAFLRERGITLDVLVLNAGITRDKMFANMTADRWDAVIAVNISSQISLVEALLSAGDDGADVLAEDLRVVSLASTSGIAGNRGQANYATSKAGVMALVAALARRLGERGTANAVAPGFIETDMTGRIPPLQREIARRANSLQQGGLPLDVAETIGFLCAPGAAGLRGQTVRVCGQNMVGR